MGSILIRRVPNGVHQKFKKACRKRKISMEQAIVELIAREVGVAARSPAKPSRGPTRGRRTARPSARAGRKSSRVTKRPARRARRRVR